MPPNRHWTALDGLRGIAVLAVLLYHFGASIGSGGYLGVDAFFVISGCVVTVSLKRTLANGHTTFGYFLRRAARLLPNLVAFLLVVFVWDTWGERRVLTSQNAAVLEGLTQTYNLFASSGIATRHLWSLSLEWQFYACLPLLLPWLCARGANQAVRRAAAIALVSIALRPLLASAVGVTYTHVYLWPVTRLDGVMLGVAVALLLEAGHKLTSPAVPAAAAIGLGGLMLFAPHWYDARALSLYVMMPAASLCAAVLVWGIASNAVIPGVSRLLSSTLVRYIGDRSYSIYLWHYFVGVALLAGSEGFHGPRRFALQVAASLVVAVVAYELVESPARRRLNHLIASSRLDEPPQQLLSGGQPSQQAS